MAGRKARGNITLTYNSQNITSYTTKTGLKAAADKLEATTLASTAKESIAADVDWSISIELNWDAALDTILAPDIITPGTKRTVVLAITGSTQTVTYTWTSNGEISDYAVDASVGNLITGSATLSLSGAPTRSVA
jgi:hypothetical protein